MLYQAYQAQQDVMGPVYGFANLSSRWLAALPKPWSDSPMVRQLRASYEMVGRLRLTHQRPPFRVESVEVDGKLHPVREELVMTTPFAALRRFTTAEPSGPRPQVLLVAAMAGHFPTLLRNTIRTMVADCDVYVTDWFNVRDVPLDEGRFGLDEYVEHVMTFLERMGPGAHLFAVCQPCPAVVAATSLMAADRHPCLPRSMTLMAGPINCNINATQLDQMAQEVPLQWFERHVLTTVPRRYAGAGRRVLSRVPPDRGVPQSRHPAPRITARGPLRAPLFRRGRRGPGHSDVLRRVLCRERRGLRVLPRHGRRRLPTQSALAG